VASGGDQRITAPLFSLVLQAVTELMGSQEVLRVICVGEGPAGGLAILCGPWAALQVSQARTQVATSRDGYHLWGS